MGRQAQTPVGQSLSHFHRDPLAELRDAVGAKGDGVGGVDLEDIGFVSIRAEQRAAGQDDFAFPLKRSEWGNGVL